MSDLKTATVYPGYTGEMYPEKFNIAAMPPPADTKKPGQLPDHMIRQFFEKLTPYTLWLLEDMRLTYLENWPSIMIENGYVLVENFFTKEELDACREGIKIIVQKVAQRLYDAGKITKLYTEYGLFERITKMAEEFPGTNTVFFKMSQVMPRCIENIWSNERLLNVVEQLIGPDIVGHPVWNLRPTSPKAETTLVPWHQDAGYLQTDSYNVLQPAAWIPFLDTNETNGCLQFVSEGHKTGKVAMHQCCYGGTWYVMLEEDEMEKSLDVNMKEDVVTVPVQYGGMVLFNNLIPHRGLPNISKEIRWSMDLRWQRASEPLGFYGLKDGVHMRSSTDPSLKVDWEAFNAVDRCEVQTEATAGKKDDELDLTLCGPWMKKWEIVHVNSHVEAFRKQEEKSMA